MDAGSRGSKAQPTVRPWKQPPLVKVYEAFTAVAAGRVGVVAPGQALVTSSNGSRAYDVRWGEDGASITSNDNGSRWQGYTGYPIIAVLLTQGRLHADPALMAPLAGVDWHALNERFKRKYDEVVRHVLDEAGTHGADPGAIAAAAESVATQLAELRLVRLGGPGRKSGSA
jgi:hypothetical protein